MREFTLLRFLWKEFNVIEPIQKGAYKDITDNNFYSFIFFLLLITFYYYQIKLTKTLEIYTNFFLDLND